MQQDVAQGPHVGADGGDVGDLDRLQGHRHAPAHTLAPADRSMAGHRDDLLVEIVSDPQKKGLGQIKARIPRN